MSFITRAIGAAKLAAKAHGPTIMVVTGVASMGASVVVASKKTLQLEEVLTPHTEKLEEIQGALDLGVEGYNDKLAAKDRGTIYGRAAVSVAKHYFVPGVLFVGGAALVFGGHRVMLKRNATLAIAFTGLQKAFAAYRENVRDEFGSEADQAMLHGYKISEVIDPETGAVTTVNQRDWDADHVDPYNRVFSRENSSHWIEDLRANKLFVNNQQRLANIVLGTQNYLYLNDVYEALGMPKTDIGQVVGWKVKRLPDGSRDIPFVDFGLDKPHPDDWKYTKNAEIYLDFNCQGLIVGGSVQKALEKA